MYAHQGLCMHLSICAHKSQGLQDLLGTLGVCKLVHVQKFCS